MREYLLTFFVAASVTYLAVGPVGRIAHWVGAVLPVRDRDIHRTKVPRLGGVAMLAGLLAAMLVASYLPRMRDVFYESSDARGLLAAAIVICVLGAADDILDLSQLTKFAGQILAAGLLVANGVQLTYLQLPDPIGTLTFGPAEGTVLTVFLVVAVVNAANFIDGLDGLAAGALGIGAAAFFSYAYLFTVEGGHDRLTASAMIAVIVIGVCAGFLPHNVHPARIFMGDSGALMLGLLLVSASITLTGRFPNDDVDSWLPTLLPLILPLAVIALPFLDMTMAVIRRTWSGRAPWAPDKRHLHHRLLEIGHSHRRAVFIMWTWAAVVSFGVVVLARANAWPAYLIAACAVVLAVALTVTRKKRPVA